MFFAQKVLAAGYTAICAPGDAGQISLSVRNAINAGLFDGPRVTAAGRYISARPTIKMLALAFLLMIGLVLVADGLGVHVPKGYVYFAMAFSVLVEMLNLRVRRSKEPH